MVENVQRRATRIVPGLKGLNYEERLQKLGLPTPQYRRHREDIIEVYKLMHDIYDPEVSMPLPMRAFGRSSGGNSLMIRQKYSRLNFCRNWFSLRVAAAWNELPEHVISAPSVKSFQKRLSRYWSNRKVKYCSSAPSTYTTLTTLVM